MLSEVEIKKENHTIAKAPAAAPIIVNFNATLPTASTATSG
jgi:hypothetical protein